LKLTKRWLSLKLNVSDVTIYLWERNKVQPFLAQIPKIIEFLGRDPFETDSVNLAERIKAYRRIRGLFIRSPHLGQRFAVLYEASESGQSSGSTS
jgi:DNA-binding XRE family transcriptional regulator